MAQCLTTNKQNTSQTRHKIKVGPWFSCLWVQCTMKPPIMQVNVIFSPYFPWLSGLPISKLEISRTSLSSRASVTSPDLIFEVYFSFVKHLYANVSLIHQSSAFSEIDLKLIENDLQICDVQRLESAAEGSIFPDVCCHQRGHFNKTSAVIIYIII